MELFIEPIKFEKLAYTRVSENPAEWTRDVMQQFYEVFPYFMTQPVRVEFREKDEQKGYAIGSIIIGEAKLAVPVIIRNRELFPFDVAIYQGQVLPLTTYTINTYISNRSPFQRVVPREQGDITTLLFGQGGLGYMKEMPIESYKMASADEVSLLDRVLPLTSEAERRAVLDKIAADDRIAEGFRINSTGSLVLKIAAEQSTETVKTASVDMARELLDRDIWYIEKTGAFSYTGIFGNSRVDDMITFDMTASDVEKLGAKVKTAPRPVVEREERLSSKPVAVLPVKGSDRAIVLLESGDYVEIPKHMYVEAPVKITMEAPGQAPEVRKVGSFKVGDEYTEPFEIDNIIDSGSVRYINGHTSLTKVAYALMEGVEGEYVENGVTWIPGDAKFVKLGKCHDTRVMTPKPARNRVVKTAGGYVLQGPELGTYAKTTQPVEHIKAAWALVQCGADEGAIEKLATLREGEILEIWNDLALPVASITKIAAEYDNLVNEETTRVRALVRDFIKEASVIPDLPTVDKVLSLNFVNKDSLKSFTDSIPLFESAVMTLADMLLKSRLGVQVVDESAIRRVMFGLLEIIEVLQGVASVKGDK